MKPDHVPPYAKTVKRALMATQTVAVAVSVILIFDSLKALAAGGRLDTQTLLHGSLHAAVLRTLPLLLGFGGLLSSMNAALSQEARVNRHAGGQLYAALFCFTCGMTMNFGMFLIR